MQTTSEHLSIFEAEGRKWIAHFGLYGWDVHFCIDEISSEACVYWNYNARDAKFVLSNDMQSEDADYLRGLALHEVLELLLAPIVYPLYAVHSEAFVDDRVHDVVRRLEHWARDGNETKKFGT